MTRLGACLSVLTILILLAYGGYKVNKMVNKADYSLYQARQDNYFDEKAPLKLSDGFQVAAAVTNWSFDKAEPVDDPTLGTLKMYYVAWTEDSESDLSFQREIKLRNCTADDFVNSENSISSGAEDKFYQPLSESQIFVDRYWGIMKCIDDVDFSLYGNYQTSEAQNLQIIFEKCDRSARLDCKSDD